MTLVIVAEREVVVAGSLCAWVKRDCSVVLELGWFLESPHQLTDADSSAAFNPIHAWKSL
jgi:hypothetical protein